MMARPSVRALTEWGTLPGTIAHTWSGDLGNAVDGYLELALDYLIYFFLRMEMLVNGRTTREIVVGECHARRVEIASVPTGQALNDAKVASVDKWHGTLSLQES